MHMKKKNRTIVAKIIAAVLAVTMIIALLLPLVSSAAETTSPAVTAAKAATSGVAAGNNSSAAGSGRKAAYDTHYSQTVSMAELIAPALLRSTNAAGVAQLLSQALRYGTITEGDIWDLIQKGYTIPTEALRLLAQSGTISGYLYKTAAGLALEPADMAAVYDKAYYISHNPAISTAIANGTLPSDDQTVFLNFLRNGMAAGLPANSSFDPAYYKANYPDLARTIGDDTASYYIHYILVGREKGYVADRLLKTGK